MLLKIDTLNNIAQFLVLLIIFGIVLAVCYFTTRFIANFQQGRMNDSNMKVIEATKIAPNKYLEIVRIGKKYYALAIGKDTVNTVCEIPEDELVLDKDSDVYSQKFSDIFEAFKGKKNNDKKEDLNKSDLNQDEQDDKADSK